MAPRLSDARLRAAARDAAVAMVDRYHDADGLSADDYDDTPRQHPMAEAKHVLACLDLAHARALGPADLARRLDAALGRLETSVVGGDARWCAWGLGYSWRDLPSDEAFVITTALVLEAASGAAAIETLPGRERWVHLRDGAARWLLDGVERHTEAGARLPVYSPHLPLVAYNVAAAWSGALTTALGPRHGRLAEVRAAAVAVRDRWLPDIGWLYGPGNLRVDLVHASYIVRGLLTALPGEPSLPDAALRSLLQFSTGTGWCDAFDVYPLQVGSGPHLGAGRQAVRISGDHLLVGFLTPARVWSLGELAVALGDLEAAGARADVCAGQRRRVIEHLLEGHVSEPYARHAMHVAHGLARYARDGRS